MVELLLISGSVMGRAKVEHLQRKKFLFYLLIKAASFS